MKEKKETKSFDDYMKSVGESLDRMAALLVETEEKSKKRREEEAAEAKKRREEEAAEAKKKREEEAAEAKKYRDDLKKMKAQIALEAKKRQDDLDSWKAENRKNKKELDDSMKKLNKYWGNFNNNLGSIAEDYFYNSFAQGKKNFFGEKFDKIEKKVQILNEKMEKLAEYDIVLVNGTSIGIIEVKYKAHKNDIPNILKKIHSIRNYFPYYKDHKIYLGLASRSFYDELEDECKIQGIAIIKEVGDTLVIYDEFIKAY